jgi:hypothetical protein
MNDKLLTILMASTVLVLCGAGFVDALRDDDTGTAVLFAFIFLGVAGLGRTRSRAGTITLRRDLASWLERASTATGETPDEMGNRAVSRLRAGFMPTRRDES